MILSLVLAAAEAHAAAPGIPEQFGLDVRYVAIQAVSFLIIFAVLYRFGIKPTVAAMDERNRKIDAGLKYAEEMKAKLEAAHQESTALVKQAQHEGTKIVEAARKTAKEFLDQQTKEAAERAGDLLAKAQQAVELEHKKMLDQARGEIARLVVATTQRVLARELSDAERARYNESASRELTVV
ncbi:MAG: ATP synthase F0 subunit B [Verrucomicrobia bacterium RIFCSPLOWO2_12_FULL_64_8]|nr:MAG: ATP synthase F0 subunit B [Verrucomicrobia bacterium RIFCSPLOWO2_12_FULL_64_8]